jgi:hypothetical protein
MWRRRIASAWAARSAAPPSAPASARGAWTPSQKFGVQLDVTHQSMSNEVFFTRMSATQFGPRILYAFNDHVSDSTWVRPLRGAPACTSCVRR